MNKTKKIFVLIFVLVLILPLVHLFMGVEPYGLLGKWAEIPAIKVTDFTLETKDGTSEITLPHTFLNREPRESLVLTTKVYDEGLKRIYFKSVYAPLKVYANGELLGEYGTIGSYPSYLDDPPVKVAMVDLPDSSEITLRFEYNYPISRNDLTIQPPLIGTYPSIFNEIVSQEEMLSALFLFFLFFGLLVLLIGLFMRVFEKQGSSFIWLGLINLCCGFWGLGEYDLAGLIIHNSSLLYLIGLLGLIYLPVAVHFYFRSTVGYTNPKPITICARVCLSMAVIATFLQALGILSLYNILPYFLVLATLSFVFSAVYTIYEWRYNENEMAGLLLFPWIIVIGTAIVEGLRFMHEDVYSQGSFAQIGLLVFMFVNSLIGGYLIQKTINLREETRLLEQEYKMMEVQVSEQQRYHNLLRETRQTLRVQRHDLHHQLAVINTLAKEGNLDKINEHLDSLEAEIPEELIVYCENLAVNAVVAYYISKAKINGVNVKVNLIVPEISERISDSNLCVIFGNVLENAVEACARMSDAGKFITIESRIQNEMLLIVVKNSFEGPIRKKGEKFYSSKRDEFGVGITSVQTVTRKHAGNANFTNEGRVFKAAIYVRI